MNELANELLMLLLLLLLAAMLLDAHTFAYENLTMQQIGKSSRNILPLKNIIFFHKPLLRDSSGKCARLGPLVLLVWVCVSVCMSCMSRPPVCMYVCTPVL